MKQKRGSKRENIILIFYRVLEKTHKIRKAARQQEGEHPKPLSQFLDLENLLPGGKKEFTCLYFVKNGKKTLFGSVSLLFESPLHI
jgi:hypothetical protein